MGSGLRLEVSQVTGSVSVGHSLLIARRQLQLTSPEPRRASLPLNKRTPGRHPHMPRMGEVDSPRSVSCGCGIGCICIGQRNVSPLGIASCIRHHGPPVLRLSCHAYAMDHNWISRIEHRAGNRRRARRRKALSRASPQFAPIRLIFGPTLHDSTRLRALANIWCANDFTLEDYILPTTSDYHLEDRDAVGGTCNASGDLFADQ